MHYIELCIYKNNELIIKYNLKVDNLGHLKTTFNSQQKRLPVL